MLARATVLLVSLCVASTITAAAVKPETVGRSTLGEPTPKWFLAKSLDSGHATIFDGESGEMQGLLSLTDYTPAVQPDLSRGLIYAAESHYSRTYHGERTDILAAYDIKTLIPSFEIELPKKVAAVLPFRQYIALLGNSRHLAVFNMTPAQSVSIVDVKSRTFLNEISTPGCALMLPVAERDFFMLCGDGTVQLIQLDRKGGEANRVRSKSFFQIDEDPIFDKPVPTTDGWQLVSFEGKIFELSAAGESIVISKPWSVLSEQDREEKWRVGGGQLMDVHVDMDLLFMIVHQGEVDTHEEPGSEIWVFDRSSKRRIARIPTGEPVNNLLVSQDESPILTVSTSAGQVQIYDVKTTRKLRTIANPGADPALLQRF
jgi:methylamine dehydrogenase heavy chain